MKVLVACEFSGTVRDAFLRAGHDAMSADLLPTESPGPHYQGDVLEVLDKGWDLMVAHPPCTYLANSGARWLKTGTKVNYDRWNQVKDGATFFRLLLNCPFIDRIAVENPMVHAWGISLIGAKPTQIVHPWQYGHMEQKQTWLWLKNLPPLEPTQVVYNQMMDLDPKERKRIHHIFDKKQHSHIRSVFFPGIADAMAQQWGQL